MTTLARVPPGRAGRLWLQRRLVIARRGVDLLQRKLQILTMIHRRLVSETERTGRAWTAACAEAETWGLRAALETGRRQLRPSPPAHVMIRWTETMGIRYPAEATCAPPDGPVPLAGSAALAEARQTAWEALKAAAAHAVAREAERRIAREVTVTRQRIRALQDRWIPRLTSAIKDIDLALEEAERSGTARLLRAGQGGLGPSDGFAGTEAPGREPPESARLRSHMGES